MNLPLPLIMGHAERDRRPQSLRREREKLIREPVRVAVLALLGHLHPVLDLDNTLAGAVAACVPLDASAHEATGLVPCVRARLCE